MSDIRYICISDLHLGADNSLLTNVTPGKSEADPTRPSDVLIQLAQCLKSLSTLNDGRARPQLILNGDVLELALAQDEEAIMAFERFMECLFPQNGEPLVANQIIFIPGNHDHHLWETARETQYAEFLKKQAPGSKLVEPWHTTKMFDADLVNAFLLNTVTHRYPHMKEVSINTAYPNLGLMSNDGNTAVMFTHGHFTEPIYEAMSELRTFLSPKSQMPTAVWDIEKENFAWIDFFWSMMGRSGAVGDDVERIYMMLLVPEMRDALAHQLGHAMAKKWAPHLLLAPEAFKLLATAVLSRVASLEKIRPDGRPEDASNGLKDYVEGPLLGQLKSDGKTPPRRATVVFGHTHKPYVEARQLTAFSEPTAIVNTGGWVVDTPDPASAHGAGIVLVDDAWNVAALRIFNEGNYSVKAEAAGAAPGSNPLFTRLAQYLAQHPEPWATLSKAISTTVDVYRSDLRKRLDAIKSEGSHRGILAA